MKLDTNKPRWTDTPVGHAVIHAITYGMTKEEQAAFYAARAIAADKSIELKLTINGVETDLESWIQRLSDDFDRQVTEAAGQLLKERLGDTLGELFDTVNQIDRGLKVKAAEMLGYDPWKDY